MPVYVYRCEECGVQFERTQKFSDAPLTRCPECGKKALRKVYSPVSIVFKGSGWYSTDNRSPSGAPRVASGKSSEEKSPSAEGKTADSTPSESKSPDSKGTDGKGTDGKTRESKSSSNDAPPPPCKPTPSSE